MKSQAKADLDVAMDRAAQDGARPIKELRSKRQMASSQCGIRPRLMALTAVIIIMATRR